MQRTASAARGWRLTVMAVAMVAIIMIAAAPAIAQVNAATELTATAGSDVLLYGGGTIVSAVLMNTDEDLAVGGEWVRLEQATDASGPWTLLYELTTGSEAYYTGTYSGPVIPAQTMYYRFVFEGSTEYQACTSNVVAVGVKPRLGRPIPPASARHGVAFTLKGILKPAFKAGAKTVTVKAYKWRGSRWVPVKLVNAKATNRDYQGYTQYRLRLKLARAGKYRFKAITSSSAEYLKAVSRYSRVLTVK